MNIRIGFGFDVHQLKEGVDFWIGGIKVEHSKGAFGHSDADVLIHAICDALLGAANLRDIGYHFSDKDPQYKGIDSKKLLAQVVKLLRENHYEIGNIDSTLVLEMPKINPHVDKMKQVLAEVMKVRVEDISIKATTNEKMGFIGREEGVVAQAVALIYRVEPKMDLE
ncbi:2-C-methyl-D-erythritol 2,4-cyclodiphosphate synthase [Cytophagales bacterium LB-30]|uniref:2-C-methyl-D-erythritol 2,4-cyclodiphosphate synthase n=1 Tax=Shiella aurantiaca TaxID=3058365 RepID=A0ABT8F764_9BACT|nr:2-C-methyl-D-erythritol 2,4-cyclodiphosphate synthase [Shiella aurantiaca]MDN4166238.1 2-C-methyl-D-erythritol 2,4-cyclodiphosphate synthase [Shiella aurantiaca]